MDTQTKLAFRTKLKYKNVVRQFLIFSSEKNKGLTFNIDDVNQFIYEKNKGTRRGRFTKFALRHFLLSVGKREFIHKLMPVKRKPRLKEFKFFDGNTANRIINGMPQQFKTLAFIQLKTGARFQEAATIKVQDIDFTKVKGLIIIPVGQYAKNMKPRLLKLRAEYEPYLKKLIGDKKYGWLVLPDNISEEDEARLINKIDNIKRDYNEKLNAMGKLFDIDKLSSHYLRHHYADSFIKQGGELHMLKSVLGHARLETTMEYVGVSDTLADDFLKKDDTFF